MDGSFDANALARDRIMAFEAVRQQQEAQVLRHTPEQRRAITVMELWLRAYHAASA